MLLVIQLRNPNGFMIDTRHDNFARYEHRTGGIMKSLKALYLSAIWAALLVNINGCANETFHDTRDAISVDIVSAEDQSKTIGTVTFVQQRNGGVVANFNIAPNDVIPPGQRAIHIHENPSCESNGAGGAGPAGAAGGHFNPSNAGHGVAHGPHVGDSAHYNYTFNADGSFYEAIEFPNASLYTENAITRDRGTAIIIHAGQDDAYTDPSGSAGPRVACGIIRTP